jgi:hypothetical protein
MTRIDGNKLIIDINHWSNFIENYVVVEGEAEENVIYSRDVCDEHECGSIAQVELIPKSKRVVVEVYSQLEEHALLMPMWREYRTRYVWDGKEWKVAWAKEWLDGRLVRKNVIIPEEDEPEPEMTSPPPEEPEDEDEWEEDLEEDFEEEDLVEEDW